MRIECVEYLFGDQLTIDECKHCAVNIGYPLLQYYRFKWENEFVVGLVSRDLSFEELEMVGIAFLVHVAELRDAQVHDAP